MIGPWLDRLQLFDVFSSFWFTAIYALLFISLVGCLTPRILEHIRSMRAVPVPAPRNLGRLPKHAEATVAGSPEAVAARISDELRGWRRVTRQIDGVTEISAEKGYLREFGNIVFHFSLLGLLAAVAVGKLFSYEGNVIVIANGGPGFCSASPAAFDSFRAGNSVDGTSLYPMCLRVNDFQARYLPNGQATSFASNIEYQAGDDLAYRHLAALPPGGQPSAAGRRGPGIPAGPRLRADVHRDLPRRAEAHPDHPVPAGRPADPAVLGHGPGRPAGRAVSGRSATQAPDRDHRAVRAHPADGRQAAVVEVPRR